MDEKKRKIVLLLMLVFLVVGLVTAKSIGKKQDLEFKENNYLYNQLVQTYNEGNYQNASLLGSELVSRVPNSEITNFIVGMTAFYNQDFNVATTYLQKTLDLNPHRVEDPMFMINFGQALFYINHYDDAKQVLLVCQQWGWVPEDYPEYQIRVAEFLEVINERINGG